MTIIGHLNFNGNKLDAIVYRFALSDYFLSIANLPGPTNEMVINATR